jgi:hypothetical protein
LPLWSRYLRSLSVTTPFIPISLKGRYLRI